ncbi:hypothetical protein PLESTB_001283300 [Pleodorina starrii]|uniref:Methyltransferase domain-containing protein n=1 Tax=Pleodorina starrii TaxID=330485 RepID=A0A9W6F6U5_9CHLO|nr:hypothetical protein PLESTM_001944500 [Pleodorina starrii]GLC57871.1 hypothetical protein PLESTB_001283300 [Pleodorina starrii]GLC69940.1 hypothetical protein PLESTF_000901000 [Pleodorina starrii]
MLFQAVAGAIALVLLFAGVAVAAAFVSPALLVATLAAYFTFGVGVSIYFVRVRPTRSLLAKDLSRLGRVMQLDEFFNKNYSETSVVAYYGNTTFRDYKLLAVATGSSAMHSALVPQRPVPFRNCGHLRQLLYVMAQMGDGVCGGRVLEVGFGKGTNTVYLADLFPGASFTGIDITPEHVDWAQCWASRLGLSNATFLRDDASAPTVSGPFNLMFGIESFCHLDTDDKLRGFLAFAQQQLAPGGRLVVVDGYRGSGFEGLPLEVRQAMQLAESGFRIRRMASKATWRALAEAAGLVLLDDLDLTKQALGFWTLGWRVAHVLLLLLPWAVRAYVCSGGAKHKETGANFVAVAMTAFAMALGSAEYGVLVFKKP